jgi:acyl transferase domain-containing protein/thioesterase domain-containing protein/acyl carrier protein
MRGTEIAVVGMAARLPGARNVDEFWRNLRDGVEAVKIFTDAELLAAGETAERLADPAYVKAQAAIEGVDQFDAGFFGFSPHDAAVMDPQHRILLEVAWEALESAAHQPESFAGSIGVFATCGMNSYMMHNLLGNRRIMETVGEWLVRHTGNDMNFLATRLSYQMNLKGPSMNVQTACSSALVAIHQAAQSLLAGECDMALAGGCTLHSFKPRGYLYRPGEILSEDGHCRPFDQRASGTLFGNGAGMVVLRRLVDALADGDSIHAVLLGSAINNDGSMKAGYLAPSVEGQSKAITEALAASGVHPETISYVEAHGTGTAVGDPIEVAALTEAYRRHTGKTGFCGLGSVKSNIGHLGEAAGAAGFIKTVLALEHRQLPPTLHFENPNARLELGTSPFVVNSGLRDWPASRLPRRAGVTALGAGGTNCHVILEEPPVRAASGPSRTHQVLTISAKTPAALEAASANLAAHLQKHPEIHLADAAYTLNAGRKAFLFRRAVVCADRKQAVAALAAPSAESTRSAGATDVAFLFPGQGSQYAGMGRDLYRDEAVFRQQVDECAILLKPELGLDLREVLFGGNITGTALAQPALFTIELALAKVWMSWGVRPKAMLGHSIGEYVAAHLAGVFSLEDALALVAARGRLMQQMPSGAMLAVHLPAAEAERYMNGHAASGRLSLAAMNAPALSVVAGSHERIAEFQKVLDREGIASQRLHSSHAFHSAMMDPVLEPFRERVRKTARREPSLPFVSNVTGRWIRPEEAIDPEYWVQHLRKPVRFAEGVATLLENPNQVLLEVGPGRTLRTLVGEHPVKPAALLGSLRRANEETSDVEFLLKTAGELWTQGVAINWRAYWTGQKRNRVALPAYPFQRQSHWIEPDAIESRPAQSRELKRPAGRQDDVADWFYQPVWKPSPPPQASPGARRSWLVFADETGLAEKLIERLENAPRAPLRLDIVKSGEIDSLSWTASAETHPGPGEVAIEVRATALNFADVLKATGAFAQAPFGMECAGVIAAVGSGVTHWKPGDEVVAIGPGSHATRVLRDARLVASKPASLTFEEAVTAPAAYMTAWYALQHAGGLKRGEKILIHAAAGGVGLAAVAIAQAAGAEVLATAGSADKRAYLNSLGVRHTFNSRTLDFASEAGPVDVVLNSLTGDFIPKSLGLLRPGGRFLEIGKRELLSPEQVPAGIAYVPIDLFGMLRNDPGAYAELFAEVMEKIRQGEWKPLPVRAFPMQQTRAAFEHMLQSKHTGKVVLTVEEPAPEIFTVRAGERFRKLGEREFAIRPSHEADYRALGEALGEAAGRIDGVAQLWNVTPASAPPEASEVAWKAAWDAAWERGFLSLTSLAKELGHVPRASSRPVDLFVISSCLQNVAGETAVDAAKALLLGPCRVIPREFEGIRCRSIDVGGAVRGSWQQRRVADQLAAEMQSEAPERTVAYRGWQRWVEEYEPTRLGPPAGTGLRERGVYLITGGLGGIGLELAEYLSRTVQARLILVGRALPDRGKLDKIKQCEEAGGEVLIARADVADLRQMRRVATEARSAFGEIHGVFHAAGVLDDGLIQLQAPDSARAVLRPKVQGTLVLEEVFGGQPLDFLALFSSVSSALGLEGQVAYSSANAFLDAFARRVAQRGGPRVVSLGWGPWKEVGMAAARAGEKTFRHKLSRADSWLLREHAIKNSEAILPGTAYLELIRSAVAGAGDAAVEISGVVFHAPFTVGAEESKELIVTLKADSIVSVRSAAVHVSGHATLVNAAKPPAIDLAAVRARCDVREEIPNGLLKQPFLEFGPRWANVQSIRYGRVEALLSLSLPAEYAADLDRHRLHPALLDMATGGAQALTPGFDPGNDFYVPFSYGRLRLWGVLPARVYSHVRLKGPATFDATLTDESGNVVCEILDFVMRPFDRSRLNAASCSSEEAFDAGIAPQDGLAALAKLLAADTPPHLFVTPVSVEAWVERTDAAARPQAPMAPQGFASAGTIEQRLATMWSQILGIKTIRPDDDFFELGGHSLLLVRLASRIETEFKKQIPLSSLFQAPTIAKIADLLGQDAPPDTPCIFPFQDHRSGPASFCVHSVSGEVMAYKHLRRWLGPEQRLYGIQLPLEWRGSEVTSSVEALAGRYVRELLAFQPEGPYVLGGWSAGSPVALEMAQQLQAQGRTVSLLVAIDGAPFNMGAGISRWNPMYYAKLLRNLPRWAAESLARDRAWTDLWYRARIKAKGGWSAMAARMRGETAVPDYEVRGYLGPEFREEDIAFMEFFNAALHGYVPRPYTGRVLLYEAQTQPLHHLLQTGAVWKKIAADLEIVPVKGSHRTLVEEPYVRTLGQHLSGKLREVSK